MVRVKVYTRENRSNKVRIDDLTIGEAKYLYSMLDRLLGPGNVDSSSAQDMYWRIGENYMIRTVTHIQIGTLIGVTDKELMLKDASWIADTGRFEQAVKDGVLNEVEPFPDDEIVIVGRGALIDAVLWQHNLPRQQK